MIQIFNSILTLLAHSRNIVHSALQILNCIKKGFSERRSQVLNQILSAANYPISRGINSRRIRKLWNLCISRMPDVSLLTLSGTTLNK